VATWKADAIKIAWVVFSPDGKRLAVAGSEGVKVWDLSAQEVTLTILPKEGDRASSADFSPDGTKLAVSASLASGMSGEGENQAWVVDAQSGELQYEVAGHPGMCSHVRFSSDGRWLITGTYGSSDIPGEISGLIWDAETGAKQVGQLESMNWLLRTEFSPDHTKMLALGLSQVPVMYDFDQQKELYRLNNRGARQAFFHPDGERFFVIRTDGFSVHAVRDGRELVTSKFGHPPAVLSADGRDLFLTKDDQSMLRLMSADWTHPDKTAEYADRLNTVQRLLELPDSN
jgi:dipeptidyl aminopeptidase/acylaminoacyl peptidase